METEKQKQRKINPKQTANIVSKITFWYTRKIFKTGFRKELEEEDLFEVLPEYDTCILGDRMESEWNTVKHKTRFPMFVAFWNMFGKYYLLLGLSRVITIILNVIRPILLGRLIYYFTPGQTVLTKFDAYLNAMLLIGLHIFDVICKQNYFFLVQCLAIKLRTAICSLIYRKLLKLPASRLREISFGKIANLITRDINVFDELFYHFNETWIGLISIAIICYNMYQKINLAVLVVVAALAVFIPLQVLAGIWIGSLKTDTSNKTDIRISILQETLSKIRNLKIYAWENFLKRRISEARKKEMEFLLKMIFANNFVIVMAIIIYNVSFYLTLMTYIWLDYTMTAEIIYFVVGSFLTIGFIMISMIPYGVYYFSQGLAAIKRMQIAIEKLENGLEKTIDLIDTPEPKIIIKHVDVSVNSKVILQDINLDFGKGLTLIMGPASSVKSAFLMTILKEFKISTGELSTEGSMSYASQEPWLFPSTIRQNILFGDKYDEKRYRDVVRVCALRYDFDQLQEKDFTIVAEGGINLSKGQQSRINLARAVYRDTDIYLIDDCFSSLDPLVARQIFINCILKFLNNKMVFLVTYNPHLTVYANNVLTIQNSTTKLCKNKSPQKCEPVFNKSFSKDNTPSLHTLEPDPNVETKLLNSRKSTYNVYKEDKKTGSISLQIYKTYVSLGGGLMFFSTIFFMFVLTQLLVSYKDNLISKWANLVEKEESENSDNSTLTQTRNQILYNYTFTVMGLSLMTLVRAFLLFLFARNVSINLHKRMLNSVINATMRFFDSTFIGNIVNRFSKDLVTVDENIPQNLFHLTAIIFETAGNLILICSTSLRLLIPIAALLALCYTFRYLYLKAGRPLKRLDASTKSPVIGYFNATLEGLPSIRVFRAQKILQEEFEKIHNLYNSASFCHLSCITAYVFVVDVLISIFLATVIMQFVIFDKGVLPGEVGLAVSQCLIMAGALYFAFYKSVGTETQMTSVERAIEYSAIESETKVGLQLKTWPTEGEINYENVYLSINNSYLLRNINIVIGPQEKVGIVGRTGAGKSSMISALFRLYKIEGRITIDDTDIKTLSLEFLRNRISIIPQDSALFNATLRANIDPERMHQDQDIWKALEIVKLIHLVPSLDVIFQDYDFTCSQKQLIGLARVLLKNNKILVLDEMVENADEKTEKLINDIIDEKFASCTVIKIAHKLQFVMTCDKILVIENGQIVEYGNPKILLQKQNSLFSRMSETAEFGAVDV